MDSTAFKCCGETEGNATTAKGPESRGSRSWCNFLFEAISCARLLRPCVNLSSSALFVVFGISALVAILGSEGACAKLAAV